MLFRRSTLSPLERGKYCLKSLPKHAVEIIHVGSRYMARQRRVVSLAKINNRVAFTPNVYSYLALTSSDYIKINSR